MEQDKINLLLIRKQKLQTELDNIQEELKSQNQEIILDGLGDFLVADGYHISANEKNLTYYKGLPPSGYIRVTYNKTTDRWVIIICRPSFFEFVGNGSSFAEAVEILTKNLEIYQNKLISQQDWLRQGFAHGQGLQAAIKKVERQK
jgi:hypothetical protein